MIGNAVSTLHSDVQVEMVKAGLQTLVFVSARKLTEIVCNTARDMLKDQVDYAPCLLLFNILCTGTVILSMVFVSGKVVP